LIDIRYSFSGKAKSLPSTSFYEFLGQRHDVPIQTQGFGHTQRITILTGPIMRFEFVLNAALDVAGSFLEAGDPFGGLVSGKPTPIDALHTIGTHVCKFGHPVCVRCDKGSDFGNTLQPRQKTCQEGRGLETICVVGEFIHEHEFMLPIPLQSLDQSCDLDSETTQPPTGLLVRVTHQMDRVKQRRFEGMGRYVKSQLSANLKEPNGL